MRKSKIATEYHKKVYDIEAERVMVYDIEAERVIYRISSFLHILQQGPFMYRHIFSHHSIFFPRTTRKHKTHTEKNYTVKK